jgi:hypothetical protein
LATTTAALTTVIMAGRSACTPTNCRVVSPQPCAARTNGARSVSPAAGPPSADGRRLGDHTDGQLEPARPGDQGRAHRRRRRRQHVDDGRLGRHGVPAHGQRPP